MHESQSAEVVISLAGVGKDYRLYRTPVDRLKEALHPFKKKYYADFAALGDVNLAIPKGETWGVIGLNGSGKSTLLKIICGVLQPSRGRAVVQGRISALLELGSGFNPEFTGRQNVFFTGSLAGMSRQEMLARFDDIVRFADIGEFLDQPVKNYSTGMLLRLAFAVAIHVSPDILVIDEALAVGDVRFQHKCMARIRSFQGASTILFVSHDLNAVVTICDRVVWLHQGRVMQIGPPKEVIRNYTRAIYEGGGERPAAEAEEPEVVVAVAADHEIPALDKGCEAFGQGGAEIVGIRLRSLARGVVDTFMGREKVALELRIRAASRLASPIVGFIVKNKLGVQLFGYNNLMIDRPLSPLLAGEELVASFTFYWPDLTGGSYGLTVAVADGGLDDHQQQHYVHDALLVRVVKNARFRGVMAVEEADFTVRGGNEEREGARAEVV